MANAAGGQLPGPPRVAEDEAANLRRMAFAGITELWDLSLCLFHRLHGGERSPGGVDGTSRRSSVGVSVGEVPVGDEHSST